MNKEGLIKRLDEVEKIAATTRVKRMLLHPFKYIHAIIFRELSRKWEKVKKEVVGHTFFGIKMYLLLPSSSDIYLTGGKSHDSEIRLARFLVNNLEESDSFVDVGAHYGYFTLLGSKLVGNNGKVFSFEASPKTYKVLSKNTRDVTNVNSFNVAVSDEISLLKFYEFPNLYSEYNTLNIDQFEHEDWFSAYRPTPVNVQSVGLGKFLSDEQIYPKIIKIDVEGAENRVIDGLKIYLSENAPFVVMEYLSESRGNKGHQEAERKLKSLGYYSFIIDKTGHLKKLDSLSKYLAANNLDSDNIVFAKTEMTS